MYTRVCVQDIHGAEHTIAIASSRAAAIVALLAAERDLRVLLAHERDPLLRMEYERMLAQTRAALAGVGGGDVCNN